MRQQAVAINERRHKFVIGVVLSVRASSQHREVRDQCRVNTSRGIIVHPGRILADRDTRTHAFAEQSPSSGTLASRREDLQVSPFDV